LAKNKLTKQLWVRLTQQSFFSSSSDVSATTCFDHFNHHQAADSVLSAAGRRGEEGLLR
jgi:hypothetical protein